jgi:hypothetical protein
VRYSAVVRVEITDEEMAPDRVLALESYVEFDSPEDPREFLSAVALRRALADLESLARFR